MVESAALPEVASRHPGSEPGTIARGMRNGRWLAAFLLVVLLGGTAQAEEPAAALAEELHRLHTAGDDEGFRKALVETKLDPWFVVLDLLAEGRLETAKALAAIPDHYDVKALPAYLATPEGAAVDKELLATLEKASNLNGERKETEAWPLVKDLDPSPRTAVSVLIHSVRGSSLGGLGRQADAAKAFRAAWTLARDIGWHRAAVKWAFNEARCLFRIDRIDDAVVLLKKTAEMEAERGNKKGAAEGLRDIAVLFSHVGRRKEAAEAYDVAAQALADAGMHLDHAASTRSAGHLRYRLGEYDAALERLERARELFQALGERRHVASVNMNLASVQAEIGSVAEAFTSYEDALREFRAVGDIHGESSCLNNLANHYQATGRLERALDTFEAALTLKEKILEQAEEKSQAAGKGSISARERERHVRGIAIVLGNMGELYMLLGEMDEAKGIIERALALSRETRHLPTIGQALGSLANHSSLSGKFDQAIEYAREALKIEEELKDPAAQATMWSRMAHAQAMKNAWTESRETATQALRLANQIRHLEKQIEARWLVSNAERELGQLDRALALAREAVDMLPLVLRGLGDVHGASARERWRGLFFSGIRAAVRAERTKEAFFFADAYRGTVLLEALETSDELRSGQIDPDLAAQERAARKQEREARRAFERSLQQSNFRVSADARKALDTAQTRLLDVVDRIQRKAKAGSLTSLGITSVQDVQADLQPQEAVVLYTLPESKPAVAVIVTPTQVLTRTLARTPEIEAAAAALELDDPDVDPKAKLQHLRTLVMEPLALPKGTRRLLIGTDKGLSYVPFALLAPEMAVTYVPSATTFTRLHDERSAKGEGILALGDPDYKTVAKATTAQRSGTVLGRLSPLPETRPEVEQIGTKTLLGADASESGFKRMVGSRARWRAVHFACHGLSDAEQPMLSALALSADEENDGFLTFPEVFGMEIPADLVTLSACESGRGRVFGAEGVVGLTRAFMVAGAPRVISSLWKVDDAATRALMTRFYELWHPKQDGRAGIPAAEALQQAQAHVRSQEKWAHPYYWGAWVLWGLPE